MEITIQADPNGKKSLLSKAALVVCVIFIVGILAEFFYFYSTIWWFDMPMHFFGGFFIGLLGSWMILYGYFRNRPSFLRTKVSFFTVVILSVCIVGIGWEIFEYILHLNVFQSGALNILDTLSDLCFDTAGGLVAILYVDFMYLCIPQK